MNHLNTGNPDDRTEAAPPQAYPADYVAQPTQYSRTNYSPQPQGGYETVPAYGVPPPSQHQPYTQPVGPAMTKPGQASPYSYGAPVQPLPQKRSRPGLWIALAVGLALIALIAGFAVVYTNRSTPTKTLTTFCDAIKNKDYPTAYDQFSSHYKSRFSEVQFEATWRVLSNGLFGGGITGCTPSNAQDNGSTGTAALTFIFGNGRTSSNVVHLINENGAWKIDDQLGR